MNKTTSALDALSRLAAKVDAAVKASPAADLERNARQHLVAQLAKQGLVTREDFEIQVTLLEKTRAKVRELEARLDALANISPPAPK